jgi:ubiquinone/menaquinone biosynthesis C-methylase UbiE
MLDCFLCSTSNSKDIGNYLREMCRILKSNGKLIIVSHGRPVENGRLEYLRKCAGPNAWSNIEHRVMPKTPVQGVQEEDGERDHYMYICTKQSARTSSVGSSVLTSN